MNYLQSARRSPGSRSQSVDAGELGKSTSGGHSDRDRGGKLSLPNVAPGSDITFALCKTGETPFLETQSATTARSSTFETSNIAVDTTFTATVQSGSDTISDETDTPTETEGQPSFGVAIVTLLGAALLALRRRD